MRPTRTHVREDRGFTLVELMIVILIISILITIAVAAFAISTSRAQLAACLATQTTVFETYARARANSESEITYADWTDLTGALVPTYLTEEPECPAGGTYTWNGDIQCSIAEHNP